MPKISVITPTNSVKWFEQAKKSLLWQTETDWEWIVLWNGGAWSPSFDPRIKCVTTQVGLPNVGALKREACTHVTSPYCVEFDHDDEMDRTCLEKVLRAFEDTRAAFVFSDGAHVKPDGTPTAPYDRASGWTRKKMPYHGEKPEELTVNERPLLLPQNVSRIWFAPDHVRAWRMDAYVACGGHNSALGVCDDQDLMMRLWTHSGGAFHHIPECLYKYVVHGQNTYLQRNAEIQDLTLKLHDQGIEAMALAYWKGRADCLDLGGGIDRPAGWKSCDTHDADVIADLNGRWPFEDDSVGVFRAHDIIEHLKNPIHTMNEAWRCLKHGGLFLIEVPSTDGRGAFQDPSHVSFWNANSMWYYTRQAQQRYITHLGCTAKFQAVRILDHFPSAWHQTHRIPYVKAHLAAVKSGGRLHGPNDWQ